MEKEQPLVSIALCTYNGEKYLEEQLTSLLNQSHQNLEIIIVDDCSTDLTPSILAYYQSKDSRIKHYQNEKNLGFNLNFSKSLSLCSSEYIAIADQDDIWAKDKIEILLANLADHLLIYHDSIFIDEKGIPSGKTMASLHDFVKGNCEDELLYHNCVSGHACLIKKELLPLVLPFPEKIYYDWWMAYTAACIGRLGFVKETLVKHRRHEESSTGKDKINDKNKRIETLKLFQDHPLTPSKTKALIKELLEGYKTLATSSFSYALFSLMIVSSKKLFHVRKKSLYSRLKFIIKECSRN